MTSTSSNVPPPAAKLVIQPQPLTTATPFSLCTTNIVGSISKPSNSTSASFPLRSTLITSNLNPNPHVDYLRLHHSFTLSTTSFQPSNLKISTFSPPPPPPLSINHHRPPIQHPKYKHKHKNSRTSGSVGQRAMFSTSKHDTKSSHARILVLFF